MEENKYQSLTPSQYIRRLFADTKDGQLEITYYPYNGEQPYARRYKMDWTEADAEEMVKKYEFLTAVIEKCGKLQNEDQFRALLTPEERTVWETYLRPYAPFEVEDEVIGELYLRAEFDSLDEEENELLERHFRWRERNSLTRLPFLRRSPAQMILRAMRYEKLIRLGAPDPVLREEGRCLAEEIVLYHCGPQEPRTLEDEE